MCVLMMGEQDVPSSPLICNAKLMSLSKDNAIESYYLCYFLSPCLLTTNECMNGDPVKVNGASSSASMTHFNSSLLLNESSPSKHNNNISSIQHNDKAQLQSRY